MRSFGKFLGRALLTLIVLGVLLWIVGPYEPSPLKPSIDTSAVSADPEGHFADAEARFDDITPGVEKRIVWADQTGQKTEWSVVYVHGFSATSQEIRPVPDLVAETLGANLVFGRLTGHGRSGDAMGDATVQDWVNDTAEVLAAGRAVGDRVLVISTSTGGTLLAAAAQDTAQMDQVAGIVFVSPNFGVNDPAAPLLTWPAARYWLPAVAGETRSFTPLNADQETYWTTTYPSVAVLPMAALVQSVVALDHSQAQVPALFYFSDEDKVVTAAQTRSVATAWGGDVKIINPALGEGDDPFRHVIAGDIISPAQTPIAVDAILDWAGGL